MSHTTECSTPKPLNDGEDCESPVPNDIASDYNWQASKNKMKERGAYLFNSELLSDVHFVVGEETKVRIPAHKLLLSMGSSMFCAMFYGSLAADSDEIEIPDVEPSAFLTLEVCTFLFP